MREKAFLGVYSAPYGGGGSKARKRLFFVWSDSVDSYEVQRLDNSYRPVDRKVSLGEGEFKSSYTFEPNVLVTPVSTRKPSSPLNLRQMSDPAEVEKTLREHFRKALVRYRRRSEQSAARQALLTLTEVEEGIIPQHKHMFADFGINLRKNSELDLALACCKRVLALAPSDDHAHFNTARVLMEMGNFDDAEQHVLVALDLAPETIIYRRMLEYLTTERRRRQRPGRS